MMLMQYIAYASKMFSQIFYKLGESAEIEANGNSKFCHGKIGGHL
jgi:hypothetical protein